MGSRANSRNDVPQFRVGSRVRLPSAGGGSLLLEVLEDRGNVGWQGSHILRVRRISEYPEERVDFEVVADSVTLAD
jgi:hypothetical protein